MANLAPDEAANARSAYFANDSDAISGNGSLRRAALREHPARADAGRRARRGTRLRRPLLRRKRHAQLKRGEYKQNFTLSRDGLISQHADGACLTMSDGKNILRQISRHGAEQRRPRAARPIDAQRAGRARRDSLELGRAVCATGGPTGPPMGVISCRRSAPASGSSLRHGDPDHPIWAGAAGVLGRTFPSPPKPGNPADPNIVIQSLLQQPS